MVVAAGTVMSWRKGLEAGDLSAEALVQHCLGRMECLEGSLSALVEVLAPEALSRARSLDRQLRRGGARGPLAGIPFVLKDNLSLSGTELRQGSRITAGYRPPFHACVVDRMLQAGAIPVATARMDEFAMGSSGEHTAGDPARNPWDPGRVPGGSSSGPAVAVAAGYAPVALGSDTGGSVRLPAAFCGITGMRPTYGALSRFGLSAMASSLDQVGLLARTAGDVAAVLSVLTGPDHSDATSLDLPRKERLHPLKPAPLKGLRVGLPKEWFASGLDPSVRQVIETAVGQLASEGAVPVEVTLPHTRYAIDTYYLINTSEVSSNLSRYDGMRFGARIAGEGRHDPLAETRDAGFGPEAKRRILLGAFCLSKGYYEAFYERALRARTLIIQDFQETFRQVDILASPASPTVAFPFGERLVDPLAMYLADVYTVPQALAALPALSVPAGFAHGLPVGLQLTGSARSDAHLLEVAHAFQCLTSHHLSTPPLPA